MHCIVPKGTFKLKNLINEYTNISNTIAPTKLYKKDEKTDAVF